MEMKSPFETPLEKPPKPSKSEPEIAIEKKPLSETPFEIFLRELKQSESELFKYLIVFFIASLVFIFLLPKLFSKLALVIPPELISQAFLKEFSSFFYNIGIVLLITIILTVTVQKVGKKLFEGQFMNLVTKSIKNV